MSSVSSLAHSQLSPYLEKLDTLEMSKPRSNHLASRLLAAPSHTAPEQKSPWDPSSNKPHWLRREDRPLLGSPLNVQHQFTSTKQGWRDADIHRIP